MVNIPKKIEERIKKGLRRYQRILRNAQIRDIKESDTVVIIRDMLSDIFGYDKFTEITTEYAIRGTYCDLAIKSGDDPIFLIEAKAIGMELKDMHLRQALDYAANAGIDWVVLTNSVEWQVYKIRFKKPISKEQVFKLNLLDVSSRDPKVIEMLFLLSKEGHKKAAITKYREERQATNRFTIATLLHFEDVSDPILNLLRKELRRIYKGTRIDKENLRDVIRNEVLKRDLVEGVEADEIQKKIKRLISKSKREIKKKETPEKSVISDVKNNEKIPKKD